MPYRFQKSETFTEGMRRILREQLRQAIEQLENEPPSKKAIHEARKSFKKLGSLLRLVRSRIGQENFKRENGWLRLVGHRLAGARDAQVRAATLDDLLDGGAGDEVLREMLAGFEAEASAAGDEAAEGDAVAATRLVLRETLDRIDDWADAEWSDARDGLQRAYRRGRALMAECAESGSDEELHDWRKRVKDLWYQLRLLRLLWPPVMKTLASEVHELANLLGDDHDLAVLRDTIQAEPERHGEKAVAEALMRIDRRRAQLQAAVWQLGARLYAEKPKAFTRRIDAWRAAMGG